MHSQAELINHLSTMRQLLVARHEEIAVGNATAELCLCRAIEDATDHDAEHPMQVAVKQMIQAAFADDGQEYHKHRYIWPVAVTTYAFRSETGFRGTPEQVAEGYTKRIALIDKWIAAAHKKLLAAVFRKAIDKINGPDEFMCCAVRHAIADLLELSPPESFKHKLLPECQAILDKFAPMGKQFAWFRVTPQHRALRIAILNLCITEVTRGFK